MTDPIVIQKLRDCDATCDEDAREISMIFHCPGCGYSHPYRIKSTDPARPVWTWNGSLTKPTFNPSLLVNQHHPESRCHLFVRDGQVQFLDDCHHALKGQTVPMVDIDA